MQQPGVHPSGQPVCRHCQGRCKVVVEVKKADGSVATTEMECPACRGTGRAGYRTK